MRAATYFSARPCSKGFEAFWASSACQPSATSYHACSAAPLPWPSGFSWAAHVFKAGRPFWPSGLTLRSSGLAFSQPLTLAVSRLETRFIQAHVLFIGAYLFKPFIRWVLGFSPGFAFWCCASFQLFCKHCAASVALCFFAVFARRQFGASRFGVWV